jgi:uncharacterized protein YndB with AHSA1/START domain
VKWLKRIGLVLAALIVLPVIVLLALGFRPGAGKGHVSTEIAAPREQVWAWLDDGARLKQWVSWLVEVRESQPPHAVGSRRALVMKDQNNGGMLMTIDGTIREFDPPSHLTVALSSSEFQFDGVQSYRLTDLGGGRTRLSIDSKFHYGQWFANLMEPLVTPLAAKKMAADLARLKSLVETKAEVRR